MITGSRKSVYDNESWIKDLIGFVDELYRQKHKLIGICFGHQLIAKALGGQVSLATAGWGAGVHSYDIKCKNVRRLHDIDKLHLLCCHQDQVTSCPECATITLSSTFCPIAGFAVANHILTFQGHPEFDNDFAASLFRLRKDNLGAHFSNAMQTVSKPTNYDIVFNLILDFIHSNESSIY